MMVTIPERCVVFAETQEGASLDKVINYVTTTASSNETWTVDVVPLRRSVVSNTMPLYLTKYMTTYWNTVSHAGENGATAPVPPSEHLNPSFELSEVMFPAFCASAPLSAGTAGTENSVLDSDDSMTSIYTAMKDHLETVNRENDGYRLVNWRTRGSTWDTELDTVYSHPFVYPVRTPGRNPTPSCRSNSSIQVHNISEVIVAPRGDASIHIRGVSLGDDVPAVVSGPAESECTRFIASGNVHITGITFDQTGCDSQKPSSERAAVRFSGVSVSGARVADCTIRGDGEVAAVLMRGDDVSTFSDSSPLLNTTGVSIESVIFEPSTETADAYYSAGLARTYGETEVSLQSPAFGAGARSDFLHV